MEELREAIYDLAADHQPMTLRNLFYVMVSAGFIDKTEADYGNVVIRLAGEMREVGELPWGWIVDNTRMMRKPDTYTGLEQLLDETARFYRRDLWASLEDYVEVWCESDSISGVLYEVTEEYDVPLMPAKGFSSKAFLFESAATIAYHNKPTTIYYVGDYDPSGVVARYDVERRLMRYLERWHHFADGFDFVHLVVTAEQVEHLDLPTKPAKTRGNTHAKSIGWDEAQGTVEAEAIPPETMRSLLRDAIESHIPSGHIERLRQIETEERATLARISLEEIAEPRT